MSAKDTAKTTDAVSVSVGSTTVSSYSACPKCAKALKVDHDGGYICSNRECRHKLKVGEQPKTVSVGSGPVIPCPKCGKASKVHHVGRICSDRNCRHEFTPKSN